MADTVKSRLTALGFTLPTPGAPAANYIPAVTTGQLLYISGQVSISPNGASYIGKLGKDYTIEEGQKAAEICAVNLLGVIKAAVGDFAKVSRMIKLTGFVNAIPEFEDAHKVINGASDLLTEVLGEQGRHSRSAIGVGTLPLGCAVEVEAIAELA
jgi:enamine deaminase RidA (YjgF/YER057c/UK114 family)